MGATNPPLLRRVRVVGAGRAGGALAGALRAAGCEVDGPLGRDGDVAGAAADVDLVVLAVHDGAIAEVAATVRTGPAAVAHLAGSLGLDVLAPHDRRAAVHPLVALPDAAIGAERLRAGAWFALGAGGDPVGAALVDVLGGRSFVVADADRARYHAAAAIASNHLVALVDQVDAVGPDGVPLEAYLLLARATIDNIAALGVAAALTGPAARGDLVTIQRHLAAMPEGERPLYDELRRRCERIAARTAGA